MLALALALAALPGPVGALACDPTTSYCDRDAVTAFLQQTPFDKARADRTLADVLGMIEHSALYDDYMAPPAPYTALAMDQVQHVKDAVKPAYQYDYEFYVDLQRAVADFHDLHQRFVPTGTPSGYDELFYILPAAPQPYLGEDGLTHFALAIYTEEGAGGAETHPFYDAYEAAVAAGHAAGPTGDAFFRFADKEITHINGKDALAYVLGWAATMNYSKDTTTSAMDLLGDVFYQGYLREKGFPPDAALTLTFADASTLTLPYLFSASDALHIAIPQHRPRLDQLYPAYDLVIGGARQYGWFLTDEGLLVKRPFESAEAIVELYVDPEELGDLPPTPTKFATAVIRLYSMSIDEGGVLFNTYEIAGALHAYKNYIGHVIIDVRNNGGGQVSIGEYLTSWLNSDLAEPHATYYRARADEGYAEYLKKLVSQEGERVDFSTMYVADPIDHLDVHTIAQLESDELAETLTYTDAQGKPYTRRVTPYFTLELHDVHYGRGKYLDFDVINPRSASDGNPYYEQILDMDRVNVTILSDGRCGSSCSIFLWDAHDTRAARILTVGGFKTAAREYVPASSTFTGGWVMYYQTSAGDVMGFIPGKSYRKTPTLVGGTPVHVPQEFAASPSDIHVFAYDSVFAPVPEDYPDIVPQVLDIVLDHDELPSAEKARDITRVPAFPCDERDHGVFGRAWDPDDEAYTGECKFLYCGLGYYEDPDKTALAGAPVCLPVPQMEDRGTGEEEEEEEEGGDGDGDDNPDGCESTVIVTTMDKGKTSACLKRGGTFGAEVGYQHLQFAIYTPSVERPANVWSFTAYANTRVDITDITSSSFDVEVAPYGMTPAELGLTIATCILGVAAVVAVALLVLAVHRLHKAGRSLFRAGGGTAVNMLQPDD